MCEDWLDINFAAVRMKTFVLLTLAFLAGSAYSNRIIGGTPTSVERYPTIVQVDTQSVWTGVWGQGCGGNILTNLHILSAAHCFAGWLYQPQYRRIRAGSSYRNTGGIIIYIVREFNHPSYGSLGYDGDISVVRLDSPLTFSPVIQQGAIPSQGSQIPDNTPVVHAGWGTTIPGVSASASSVLLETMIYTVNNQLCADRYETLNRPMMIVTPNMICAGLLDVGGRDACQGDSGGPLYYSDPNQGDIIVGIVSWGEGCANATFPGVSAAVSPYTNWIQATAV